MNTFYLPPTGEPLYAMPKESPTRFTQERKIITFDGTEIDKNHYIRGDSTEIYEKMRYTQAPE